MRRSFGIGLFLVVHGLAHANVAIWASSEASPGVVTTLWGVALLGYVSTGLGWWGVPVLRDRWKAPMLAATLASLVLLFLTGGRLAFIGMLIDAILVVVAFAVPAVAPGATAAPPRRHPVWWSVALLAFIWVTLAVLVRPVYVTWGTTAAERRMPLPGDEFVSNPRYRVDHGITIRAPADSVWPWLVQLGQDRGGFYSYDRLERLVGDDIRNADRIHPEWQDLSQGDLVRAVQPGYLGGVFGDSLGWRVKAIEPGRAMVLNNWGAFVLVPVDEQTTRFIVRTRGDGTPSMIGLVFGPLNVFVFEPMHFIMQRGMLRGVRARAERRTGIV